MLPNRLPRMRALTPTTLQSRLAMQQQSRWSLKVAMKGRPRPLLPRQQLSTEAQPLRRPRLQPDSSKAA